MKKKPKKYVPRFTLDEIKQLIAWYNGYFTDSAALYKKLLRIRNKLNTQEKPQIESEGTLLLNRNINAN